LGAFSQQLSFEFALPDELNTVIYKSKFLGSRLSDAVKIDFVKGVLSESVSMSTGIAIELVVDMVVDGLSILSSVWQN
jgi:hypothetical protein